MRLLVLLIAALSFAGPVMAKTPEDEQLLAAWVGWMGATDEAELTYAMSREPISNFNAMRLAAHAVIAAGDGDHRFAVQLLDLALPVLEAAEPALPVLPQLRDQRARAAANIPGQDASADQWRAVGDELMANGRAAALRGDHAAAVRHLGRALRIYRWTLPADHWRIANASFYLAQSQEQTRSSGNADGNYRRMLDIYLTAWPDGRHPYIITGLQRLGTRAMGGRHYELSEQYWRQLLAIFDQRRPLPGSHIEAHQGLAAALAAQGRHAESESVLLSALSLLDAAAGHASAGLSPAVLISLANAAQATGRGDEAAALFRRVADPYLGGGAPMPLSLIAALDGLIEQAMQHDDLAQAEALMRQALQVRESNLPPRHIDIGRDRARLALLMARAGRQDEAREMLARAREVYSNTSGTRPDHGILTDAWIFAAFTHDALGEPESAARILRQAWPVREALWPAGHPGLDELLVTLARLLVDGAGAPDEALGYARLSTANILARVERLHADSTTRNLASAQIRGAQNGFIVHAVAARRTALAEAPAPQ